MRAPAASTYIGYDINAENPTTDYHSGQGFHIDATVPQHLPLGPGFVGLVPTLFICKKLQVTAAAARTWGALAASSETDISRARVRQSSAEAQTNSHLLLE